MGLILPGATAPLAAPVLIPVRDQIELLLTAKNAKNTKMNHAF
jgi:hypothetical protein